MRLTARIAGLNRRVMAACTRHPLTKTALALTPQAPITSAACSHGNAIGWLNAVDVKNQGKAYVPVERAHSKQTQAAANTNGR